MALFTPADAAEAAEMIASAAADTQSLDIVAGGSKAAFGRPREATHTLDIARLAGIVDYDPSELVLTARAATPMAAIEAALLEGRQMLAFEPPDWRHLFGSATAPTIGGVIACNLAGSRRVRAGAARDHFLGFAAINGRGEMWKAGGRVVKNVTGYDMCKLQAGAFGTLSVLTEVSLRVMPRPETAATLMLHDQSDDDAIVTMAQALNTPHEVSAAAYLPLAVAAGHGVMGHGVTALRLEGPAPSVAFRLDALEALLGDGTRLDAVATARFWTEIGAVAPLLPPEKRLIWRLSVTPSAAATMVRTIHVRIEGTLAYYDWGGGLVWLSLDRDVAGIDAGAGIVRAAVRQVGGHATLVAAPESTRAAVEIFESVERALDALNQRVKQSFDPLGVLNPGRLRRGR